MKTVIYNTNWNNKLFCDSWSSIRLANSQKYVIGEEYVHQLIVKNRIIIQRHGKLIYTSNFLLENMTLPQAHIDSGYDHIELKKLIQIMYKNSNIDWTKQPLSFLLFTSKY